MSAKNKGTGAGGANTNKNGKAFEEKTSHLPYLHDFVKHAIPGKKGKYDFYYEKKTDTETITYLSQGGLKSYFKWKFDKSMSRCPDEAYLIQRGDQYILRVLEKKNQNVDGSVDTKLLAGPMIQLEYTLHIKDPRFRVQYAFCLSTFLKKMYVSDTDKWNILRDIFESYGIAVFFGDDADYHEKLDGWVRTF